jgi:release factor glutamine methyltransferase
MYEVSEDSYLLRNTLRDHDVSGQTAIDVGAGSGVITALLADRYDEVIGVDIDPDAVSYCKERFENTANVTIHESDRFAEVQVDGADIITCNPPYLPSTAGEQGDVAIDGGESGVEYTRAFLDEAQGYLAATGVIYFVASDKADLDRLHDYLEQSGYVYQRVNDTRYFFETLYVYTARITD